MDSCMHCGEPGVWRDYHVDELCICTACEARLTVEAAIQRQKVEAGLLEVRIVVPLWWGSLKLLAFDLVGPNDETLGRNRRRKRQLRQGLVSERQRRLKLTRRYWRGVAQLEDDAEHGRTRAHGAH